MSRMTRARGSWVYPVPRALLSSGTRGEARSDDVDRTSTWILVCSIAYSGANKQRQNRTRQVKSRQAVRRPLVQFAEGCLGTRHGSHMPSGRALWVGLYLTILRFPSLIKSNRAVRTSTKTDRRQRHTAEVPGKNMGVGVSAVDVGPLQARDPCPAQAPNVFVLIGAAGRCPSIITSISG